ncbi:MAG TPA: amino acid permease [Gammaproteobacteria bacterium]|jgi:APA family basic amino acid/polyamine antiporter|nr:amino acid permease [Gammaproteobacteria bacterium]
MDKKALSLPILIALVVGNMIGTGIYLLPASLAHYGTISILAWIFTAIGTLFLAFTFTSLNKRYSKTGGLYAFCKKAFGRPTGFIIAYTYWASFLVSVAAVSVAAAGYLGFLIPSLNAENPAYAPYATLAVELCFVWLFTFINLISIHIAGVVQLVLTVIKIAPLILIILVGFGSMHLINLEQFSLTHTSSFTAISGAATLTFWAFIGLESAIIPAENTRGPRDIYIATIVGTLIVSIIYILSTIVLMGMIPSSTLADSQFPFAEAATLLFGPHAASLIALCAVISALGAINVCILIQGQIAFAAARDHLFPQILSKLSRHDVPIPAQILSSSLVTFLLFMTIEPTLLKQFNNIALFATLLTLITYFAATIAELKFLWLEKVGFSFRWLFSKPMLVAIVAMLYSIWMISNFDAMMLLSCAALMVVGLPVYFFTLRARQ